MDGEPTDQKCTLNGATRLTNILASYLWDAIFCECYALPSYWQPQFLLTPKEWCHPLPHHEALKTPPAPFSVNILKEGYKDILALVRRLWLWKFTVSISFFWFQYLDWLTIAESFQQSLWKCFLFDFQLSSVSIGLVTRPKKWPTILP